jgi:hypothetical protein
MGDSAWTIVPFSLQMTDRYSSTLNCAEEVPWSPRWLRTAALEVMRMRMGSHRQNMLVDSWRVQQGITSYTRLSVGRNSKKWTT